MEVPRNRGVLTFPGAAPATGSVNARDVSTRYRDAVRSADPEHWKVSVTGEWIGDLGRPRRRRYRRTR